MTNEKGPAPGRVAERRTHPRYGFNADAEVTEESGSRIEARITDISQRGCYVETTRSFALGTTIKVQMIKGSESFCGSGQNRLRLRQRDGFDIWRHRTGAT
jgi:hypothetical protein